MTYTATVNGLIPGGTVIVNTAQLTYPTLNTPLTASANVTVGGGTTVKIGVYNEAGELVQVILVQQFSQPITGVTLGNGSAITSLDGAANAVTVYDGGTPIAVWNGLTSAGNPATNGTYYIQVQNTDSAGVVHSVTQQVTVSRTLASSSIVIYNEAGEAVKTLYSYQSDPGPAAAQGMRLSSSVIEPGGPAGGAPSALTITLGNGVTVVWDGTSSNGAYVQNGQYFIEVHTANANGSETTVVEQVSVDGRASGGGMGTVSAAPNILRPGSMTAVFHTTSTQGVTMKVALYTVAGELLGGVTGDNGAHPPQWNAGGAASGTYLAVVELRTATGGLLGHQVLKILVIH